MFTISQLSPVISGGQIQEQLLSLITPKGLPPFRQGKPFNPV